MKTAWDKRYTDCLLTNYSMQDLIDARRVSNSGHKLISLGLEKQEEKITSCQD